MFLDANVVLYAVGAPHPHREACVALLDSARSGAVCLVLDAEVLQEILHVLVRRGKRSDAILLVRRLMRGCSEVLHVTGADLDEACSFVESLEGVSVRDAVHAAVMLRHGIRDIVSLDADFDRVPGLRRLTPADAARR